MTRFHSFERALYPMIKWGVIKGHHPELGWVFITKNPIYPHMEVTLEGNSEEFLVHYDPENINEDVIVEQWSWADIEETFTEYESLFEEPCDPETLTGYEEYFK